MDGLLSYLSPDEQRMAMQNARTQGLLGLGAALLQGSTGAPGQGKPRLGQILGQALPVGIQAYQGGIDQTLQQIMVGQKMQEMQRQREMQARQQQAQAQLAQMTQPVTPLTALSAPGRAGPTAERAETIGQVPQMTREQALRMAMNPDLPATDREALFKYVEATKPAEPKLGPGVVGEFQAAQAAGLVPAGTTLQQFVELKKPPAPSATAIAGGTKDVFGEESQKRQATRFSDISTSGDAARRSANDVRRLEGLIGKVETGGAAAFKQAAGNLGINTKGLDDIQALQAVINKLVPAQRPAGSGTMSDADLALYKESLPRIINQPGANREIVRSMKEINQYLIEEGKIADMVLDGSITPAEGRKRLAALGNPVQDFFDRTQPKPAAQPPMKQSDVDLINRFLRR
jgi:hypothetical protein